MASKLRFAVALLAASFAVGVSGSPASADVLTVNTNDDLDFGSCDLFHCSLREAIREANTTPGTDTIAFDIPGLNKTISPATPLPPIKDPAIVDGTTQPGYAGAPLVVVRAGNGANQSPGLDVRAGDSVIRGLAINSFEEAPGVLLELKGGNLLEGNYIGDVLGPGTPNRFGIQATSDGNLIGGTSQAARNVVSANAGSVERGPGAGIVVTGAGNRIQGNFIGTNPSGLLALPNKDTGIVVSNERNLIGGAAPGAGNVISGNEVTGVELGGVDNRILGNSIGLTAAGGPLGNRTGVLIPMGSTGGHVIGGRAPNVIAYNRSVGLEVRSSSGNAIRRNSIYSNSVLGLSSGLGIDLGGGGVTANDLGDADTGPNNLQNYPVLTSAALVSGDVTIQGSLNSLPAKTFLLDFFSNEACDASTFGEGKNYLGSALIATDGAGDATFSKSLPAPVPTDRRFTATATGPGGDTSEFSQCVTRPVVADLSLTKDDNPDPVKVGDRLQYLLSVHNAGPDTSGRITLTDTLPASMTFVSAITTQGSCTFTDKVVCTLDALAPGAEDAQVEITVTPTQAGDFTNSATVRAGRNQDPDTANNEDSEVTTVEG